MGPKPSKLLGHREHRDGPPAQNDPARNPNDGIYSGTTKRLAISDGSFVDIQNLPQEHKRAK